MTVAAAPAAPAHTPTPQGVNHPTFKPAKFDHGLSVPGLYAYHAEHSPKHAVFTYSDPETGTSHDITYAEAWRSIGAVASIISSHVRDTKPGERPIIGVLALSDTLSYIYVNVAIMSLGYIAYPLSPRNNPVVTAHLLEATGTTRVFVSADAAMQGLIRGAADILAQKGIQIDTFSVPRPEDHAQGAAHPGLADISEGDTTIILHSSGTTALPKPIRITRRGLVNLSNIPCYGEVDLAGKRIAAHTNPMFHAMGLATLIWPLSSGAVFAIYKPTLPPTIPTPANFLSAWEADKCDIVFCVPVFIEAWGRDPSNLPALQALDCIVYSGASVNKTLGDALVNAGVTMHPFWGSTEVGPATMFVPKDTPSADEWEYFKMSRHIEFVMEPQPESEGLVGLYEPIMVPTEICFPHVTNAERDGRPVFAVGDLLERHPTDAGRWRVYGRRDDQLVLATGENVNPVPIEGMIAHDPRVASVLMFGRHRIDPGLLVEPSAGHEVPDGDAQKLREFVDAIWPSVEKANERAPEYARVKKNMILVASPAKPLEHTPKGTPRRGVCLRLYESEIDALYARVAVDVKEAANQEFLDRV
ncbi:acetyl-CoA synthetase-like protein [Lentinus tigrinus ALCF2SS1-7]|uniref:Acetyl-CoA synthetase-like protein n=1 Tax=Lentinus tigrinus ALCF2SS1-6 TaxID=1328759 RepID=A0A5C2S1E7_9APHY|nr:acetyl-CoA synthetase-like protein [Lentinus tigrinus ALCF2SS1-6]RPD71986.1 acetyl-CoA synthetase-like protein [Lentinus tigrinus ALCF2SS1-7]